ncbi:MAG: iron ABC transporter permease [Eubacteriales bacterium]
MKRHLIRPALLGIIVLIFGVVALALAFLIGSSGISLSALFSLLGGQKDATASIIFFNLRLPRALLALSVGGALSVSGASLQGMFKNPMADSYVVGVSSGAALGATIAMSLSFSLPFISFGAVTVFAFLGGLTAMFTVYNLARIGGKVSTFSLILAGIAITSLASALIYCLMIIFRDKMEHIILWTMGSFSSSSWTEVSVGTPVMLVSSALCWLYARDLNIMLQGDEAARHLGVNPASVRRNLLIFATIASAAAVSVSGIIGFVGLVIPHVVRILSGPDHRTLIPLSFMTGGVFLLLADTLARNILPSQELPVGVITALIGVPFFLYLLRKGRKTV